MPAGLFTPWRLRAYPLALFGAVLIAFTVFVGRAEGIRSGSGRLGGDLPAFVGAARLVDQAQVAQLYDVVAQQHAQAGIVPAGTVLPFAYPPAVAAIYVPLARVPFVVAYVIHAALMIGAVYSTVRILAAMIPRFVPYIAPITAVTTLFYPMARAVFGGQNTALSLLLATGAYASRSDFRRGIWLGAWLFKPQLAVPVIAVVALRRPRVLLGVAPMAAVWWGASAMLAGPTWMGWWWREGALPFTARDRPLNAAVSASLFDVGAGLGEPFGWALTAAAALTAAVIGARRPALAIPVTAALAPTLAPHALFYDAGLAMLPLLVLASHRGREGLTPLALLWAAALLQIVAGPWCAAVCIVAAIAVARDGGAGPGDVGSVSRIRT